MPRDFLRYGSLAILAILATAATLRLAQPVLAPLALAFVVALVLTPVSDFWNRIGFGDAMTAALTFLSGLIALAALLLSLQPIAYRMYENAPEIRSELRSALNEMRWIFEGLSDVTDEMTQAIEPAADTEKAPPTGQPEPAPAAEPARVSALPQPMDLLFAVPAIAGQVLIFVGGLFFMLLCRSDMHRWFTRMADAAEIEPRVTDDTFREAERQVARYFLTITLINVGLGVTVALAFRMIGFPAAAIWGIVVALMNFIVYLGPALAFAALLVAGTVVFDGPAALLPALVFVTINFLEGQFITPSLVGRQMRVSPLLVFLSLCLWLWLWGPVGGFVAIPLLVWTLALVRDNPEVAVTDPDHLLDPTPEDRPPDSTRAVSPTRLADDRTPLSGTRP